MSYSSKFDEIWDNIIQKSLLYFCEKLGVKHKPLFLLKRIMKYRYNKYKDAFIKGHMYLNTKNIDRHKISSCIAKSILVTKPLYIPLLSKIRFVFSKKPIYEITSSSILEEKYFMFLNEYFALEVIVSIIDSYIASDNRENRFKHKIILPEPFPVNDSDYLMDVCIGLHYSGARKFNIVAFANTLFLWEKYSCRRMKCSNLEKAFENELLRQGFSEDEISEIIEKAEFGEWAKDNLI